MKIIQFSDSFLPIMDGVGNVVYQYARNMGEKGHEVYVVAPQTDTGYRGRYPFEIVDYIGLPIPKMKQYRVGLPINDVHFLNRLNMIDADIVHVHSPFIAGQIGLAYAERKHVPVIATFHSKYYDDFLQVTGAPLLAEVGVKYVVDFYEKCDEVWAVSHSSADVLRSYGYEGAIRVMENGTDIHEASSEDVKRACEEFHIQEGPMLLYVGQINWKKNLKCTLEAVSKLTRPYQMVLAGQGPNKEEIERFVKDLGIEDKVIFTGHILDHTLLNGLYKRADLFLFPSLYDTSGLVVREAAAVETPSVVVRGSSAAEGIVHGENGFLCENDSSSLAEVIEKALSDPKTLHQVGIKAKETIPIAWSLLVDRVLEDYDAIGGSAVSDALEKIRQEYEEENK